jgi:DNA-binding transcriptional MerR regulator
MERDTLYSIGELARRTGLTVKAIRFYSERGIVASIGRNSAGHRLYDASALGRLEFLRTMRGLGLDLATIRTVLDGERSLAEVAAVHAEAVAVQISMLRVRQAVLAVAARHGATPEEMELMSRLARLSEDERRRLAGDFLSDVFGEVEADPHFAGISRSMTPELSDDADAVRIQAWVELAELARDRDFRAVMRQVVRDHATERARSGAMGVGRDLVATVCARVRPVMDSGTAPDSPEADAAVAGMTAHYARLMGHDDDIALRRRLVARLERANDPRRRRYMELLSRVNGWLAPADISPLLGWSVQALCVWLPA